MMRTNVKLERRSSRPHMDEPVMIAGQAPVEPKPRLLQVKGTKKTACRRRKWVETLGIGKEMMHIVAIVRSLRLDFRCFGAVPTPLSSSSSSDEEENADHEDVVVDEGKNSAPAVENNGDGESEKMNESEDQESHAPSLSQDTQVIKRCASAPAKGWETRGHDQEKEEEERKEGEDRALGAHKLQQGNQEQSERLILMSYAPDFFRVSPGIANKTWNQKSTRLLHRSHSLMR
ncbi:uncharacterized protein LOC116259294 [Nymphaea colorata]|uniref:uncharacterized protein LOC116259294 n=1 Tax=Nymphaea colorata TaxID=210225 RepID=UPI00129E1D33|nr:uncharacterized protein LOC116259294 [Nymphaea colorata]